jgi:hypothetical protein
MDEDTPATVMFDGVPLCDACARYSRAPYAQDGPDTWEATMEEKDELLEGIASGKPMLTRARIEALLRMRRERQRKKKASK